MSMFSRVRATEQSEVPPDSSAQHAATTPDNNVIYVSPAEVKAARLLVDLAARRKEAVDPAVLAIANAQKANGHRKPSVEASSRPLPTGPVTPSVA